jgi:SNF2 family DNA or RNA helicase
VDNRALLLKLRNPQRVTTVIPKSKQLPDNRVLVNWGVEESHVLKNLNINVPSPIEGLYDWPGKYKPFSHQRTTSSFFTLNRRSFCFNEQGTGKTASAIWASDFLMKQGRINRVLIICPLSIMDSAWRTDLFDFAPHRSVDIAYGSAKKRKEIIKNGAEYVIINYDGIEIVFNEIANGGFDLIIADEATHYKNAQTKRWKALNRLITPSTWLWMMTGTPAAQSPLDAFGLAKLVNPNSVPRFFSSFRDQVMYKITNFKWVPKEDATDRVFNALQPAIRFTKDQCMDLPAMTYVKRKVELTRQQKAYYDELKSKMVIDMGGERVTSINAAVNMNKLLQISAGAIYTDEGELCKDGITTEIIRGDVSAPKRTEIFRRFQKTPDPKVLVIQPQAAAHGVTLTAANTVVWWGPTSSLETYAQANARVHRAGQDHKCTVVQLEGSYIEKRVYSLLDNRIDVHTKMIDLYKEILD